MSGNAHQRKLARDNRELLELGRRQRVDLESRAAELATLAERHAAELASVRAGYEEQLAEVQRRYVLEIGSWARAARTDADKLAGLRGQFETATARADQLQAQLDELKRQGVISQREHHARVAEETARLRERLRRVRGERLAPKRVVFEHVARGIDADPAGDES